MIDHHAGERGAGLAEMTTPQPDAAELQRRAEYAHITSSTAGILAWMVDGCPAWQQKGLGDINVAIVVLEAASAAPPAAPR
jgi:hypothetical protein